MTDFISKKTLTKLKILAWYQIIGGIVGICSIIWVALYIKTLSLKAIAVVVVFLILYSFSVYCGTLLLNRKYQKGLLFTLIHQIFQIVNFSALGYTFLYVSGMILSVGLNFDTQNFIFRYYIASEWKITLDSTDKPLIISINFIAVYGVYIAEKLSITLKKEAALNEDHHFEHTPEND